MNEQQLMDRHVRHRLAVLHHAEEVTGNVAMTCRYYGITRQTFYTWNRRFDEDGLEGLRPRSRRPKVSPNATHVEVVGKIIYLRQNYHFGPGKIAMYLSATTTWRSRQSGVWRILKRLDLNRLPASQRYKRLRQALEALREAAARPPGPDRRQVRRPRSRASRRAAQVLPVHRDRRLHPAAGAAHLPALDQKTAIQFVDYVLQRLPFRVEVIQTDNGAEFRSAFH